MRAQDLMTRTVRTVGPAAPVRQVARLMVKHGVSAVPVVDRARQVLGIISEKDLLRRSELGTARRRKWWAELLDDPRDAARDYIKSSGAYARDVMSRPVVSVAPGASTGEIAELMEKWAVKRLPVVRQGKLVGIVSRRDLVRALSDYRPLGRRGRLSDRQLAERLRQRLTDQRWIASSFVNFTVHGGRVEISGVVPSAEHREAVRAFAEAMEGVRTVLNRLTVQTRRGD